MCSLFCSLRFCQSNLSFHYIQACYEQCVDEQTNGTQRQLCTDTGAVRPAWEINDTPYWTWSDMVFIYHVLMLHVILLIFIFIALKYTCPWLWASVGMAAHPISVALAPTVELMFALLGLIKLRCRVNMVAANTGSTWFFDEKSCYWCCCRSFLSLMFVFVTLFALLHLFFVSFSFLQGELALSGSIMLKMLQSN